MKQRMHLAPLEQYLRLPYTRVVEKIEDERGCSYLARIAEIPWIQIDGSDPDEALLKLQETFVDALDAMIAEGDEIPLPVEWPLSLGEAPAPRVAPKRKARRTSPPAKRTSPSFAAQQASAMPAWSTTTSTKGDTKLAGVV